MLTSEVGKRLIQAREGSDKCKLAQAELAAELDMLGKVSGFRSWQQFHNPKYRTQQNELDQESGLQEQQAKRMKDWGDAYFQPDSLFPCYRFTEYGRLTMRTLVMGGGSMTVQLDLHR